nr:MAG TPA: hypothetical protein [Bacteriophage sp.]
MAENIPEISSSFVLYLNKSGGYLIPLVKVSPYKLTKAQNLVSLNTDINLVLSTND